VLGRILMTTMLASAVVGAQGQGGGGGGQDFGGGGDTPTARALTPIEQFASNLKLDLRTQGPMIEEVLNAAATDAKPIADEMLQVRQRWVNAILSSRTDEAKAAAAAYTPAAARMTALETRAFMRIFEQVKPAQQTGSGPAKAFDILAGFFQPPSVRSGRGGGGRRGGGGSNISAAVAGTTTLAQRRGGGGGGAPSLGPSQKTRLDILEEAFQLTKDQRKAVKTSFDDVNKTATPVRAQLMNARAGIVSAIQAHKPQGDIDAAVQGYAVQATAMAEIELNAMAKLLQGLEKDQRANAGAIETTFFLMRNMFLEKNWDDIPGTKGY